MPVTYFELWMTRLMGYLPEFSECIVCGRTLNGSRAFFHALADGLDVRSTTSGWRRRRFRRSRGRWRRRCFARRWKSFAGDAVAERAGRDLRKFLIADPAAAYREKTGNRNHAGKNQLRTEKPETKN